MSANKEFNYYEIIYDPSGAYVLIELTQKQWAKLDIGDWDRLKEFKWNARWNDRVKSFYVAYTKINKKKETILMHRMVMEVTDSKILIDHIHHDTLDNRKSQLRRCNRSQNQCNQRKRRDNSSGHIGISKLTTKETICDFWLSRCQVNGSIQAKRFPFTDDGLKQAIAWRADKVKELHKEFAYHI